MPGPQPPKPLQRVGTPLAENRGTVEKLPVKRNIGVVRIGDHTFMFDRRELIAFAITNPIIVDDMGDERPDPERGPCGSFRFRNGWSYEFTHLRNQEDMKSLEAQVGEQWDPDTI